MKIRDAAVSVRGAVPAALWHAGRDMYTGAGEVTAPLRLQPGFIMVGAQRCGTTSLFRVLTDHPQTAPAAFRKGVNYFDLNYHRGMRWYRGHFPIAGLARRRPGRHGDPVAFEASGYYLYHPFAVERIARDLPQAKLIVMLRDPVERAFSAYKHEYARGYERESFEEALRLEDERLAGEVDRMRDDISYESFSHRHHSYRHRGHYAEQLERVLDFFPRSQLHVVQSECFFAQPAQEYRKVVTFLGLRVVEPSGFPRFNARPGTPMQAKTRQMLEEYYAPHDDRLAKILDQQLAWVR